MCSSSESNLGQQIIGPALKFLLNSDWKNWKPGNGSVKRVFITFEDKYSGEVITTASWRTETEFLHDAFLRMGVPIKEIELGYKDNSQNWIPISAPIDLVEAYNDLNQPEKFFITAKVTRTGILDRATQKLEQIKKLFVGDVISHTERVKSESQVQTLGIVDPVIIANAFKGENYFASDWETIVEDLKTTCSLSDKDYASFKHADKCDNLSFGGFEHKIVGGVLCTQKNIIRTCLTKNHDDPGQSVISVFHANFEAKGFLTIPTHIVEGTYVTCNNRKFAVFPPADPNAEASIVTPQIWFSLPAGAKIVNTSDPEFNDIMNFVMKVYPWGCEYLVVADSSDFHMYGSKKHGTNAGKFVEKTSSHFEVDDSRNRYRVNNWRIKLLTEIVCQSTVSVLEMWEREIEKCARAKWADQIGHSRADE